MQQLKGKLKQAAQMYEKQFLRQMVRSMRDSVSHSQMTKPSMAEAIYREQLDHKYVDDWVAAGGTGFSDMIYQELVDKFYPQLADKKIPKANRLSNRNFKVTPMPQRPSEKRDQQIRSAAESLFKIHLAGKKEAGPSYLNVPWKGKLESEFNLESGEKVAVFSHPFGLKSTLVFQGQMEPGLLNKEFAAGEKFAQLGPEPQLGRWQVSPDNSRKGPQEAE